MTDGEAKISVCDLLTRLERSSLATDVYLFSGFSQVIDYLREHRVLGELRSRMTEDQSVARVVWDFAVGITQRPIDPQYESPYDPILTALLSVLASGNDPLARAGAMRVLGALQTRLAARLARDVLANRNPFGGHQTAVHDQSATSLLSCSMHPATAIRERGMGKDAGETVPLLAGPNWILTSNLVVPIGFGSRSPEGASAPSSSWSMGTPHSALQGAAIRPADATDTTFVQFKGRSAA